MKQKTKKTLAKRVKITGTGKLRRKALRTGHLKRKWSANQKYRKKGYEKIKSKSLRKKMKNMLNV